MAARVASPPDVDALTEIVSTAADCRTARDALGSAYVRGDVREEALKALGSELQARARAACEGLRGVRDEMLRAAARAGRTAGEEKEPE